MREDRQRVGIQAKGKRSVATGGKKRRDIYGDLWKSDRNCQIQKIWRFGEQWKCQLEAWLREENGWNRQRQSNKNNNWSIGYHLNHENKKTRKVLLLTSWKEVTWKFGCMEVKKSWVETRPPWCQKVGQFWKWKCMQKPPKIKFLIPYIFPSK